MRAYSPIVMLRDLTDVCDDSQEQYEPTTVDVMLGNPRVRLIGPKGPDGRRTIKRAPTAANVVNLGPDYHLDVPGDALNPGCTYAKDFRALKQAGRAPPITYAHIATEAGRPGLVVQYWFFYYFNQFNDVHEGDWEGMQIAFDASSPRSRRSPTARRRSRSSSTAAARRRTGTTTASRRRARIPSSIQPPAPTRPSSSRRCTSRTARAARVWAATTPRSRCAASPPHPVLIPDQPGPGTRFQWLTYFGHWGEQQKGYNNGPTGPLTKSQWDRAVHLDGRAAPCQPQAARRLAHGPGRDQRVLRHGRDAVDLGEPRGKEPYRRPAPAPDRARPDRAADHPHALAPGRPLRACASGGRSGSWSEPRGSSTGAGGARSCS